ncbi:hypothetical protein VTO42DRAFT_1135 [Malbranchea cinnamomea]
MTFFVDWELWAKMCFVLGCLIVLVLIYGTVIQFRNRHRTKKLLQSGGLQKSQRSQSQDQGADIPFGARALESGIEIEGIWISKPNTPIPSPHQPGTPVGSRPPSPARAMSSRPPSGATTPLQNNQSVTSLKLSQANNGISAHAPESSDGHYPERGFTPDDHPRSSNTFRREAPHIIQIESQRGYLQPGNENILIHQSARSASGTENNVLNGHNNFVGYPPAAYFPQNGQSGRFMSAVERPLRPTETNPPGAKNHGDLQSLYNHRLYHAAEIGQLGSPRNSSTKLAEADPKIPNSGSVSGNLGSVAFMQRGL